MRAFIKISRRASALIMTLLLLTALLPAAANAEALPLVLQSAAVTTGGGVGLTFDRAVSGTDFVNRIKTGFTITGLDRTLTITNATLHGGSNNFVQLYFAAPVRGGEAVGLSYAPGSVQAADGGLLAPIASMDIVNNLPHPALSTGTPPPLVAGEPFAHTLSATGGTAPYRFSIDSGSLPPGLTLSTNGTISGTPTQAGTFQLAVLVVDAVDALDLQQFTVTVQEAPAEVCEISGTRYLSLDAALSTIQTGGTATVKLLKNIDHQGYIFIEGKTITFDLNGHTLNVVNSAPGGFGIAVQQGGALDIIGSGALNATGDTYGVRVSTNALASRATVTNAAATGYSGEAAYAAGANAVLNVLGSCTAPQSGNPCVHALSSAAINVYGSVTAWNQGVYASGARIYVAGSVTASGVDSLNAPIGIGAGSYDGSVTVVGNVTASRVGVMARANGTVTVDGTITAPDYIRFADDDAVAPGDFVTPTTKEGYRTYYSEGLGTVWVKGEYFVPPVVSDPYGAQYSMEEGGEKSWSGPSGGLSFRSSGEICKFMGVAVDGKQISPAHYFAEAGSTVVTLRPGYLRSLAPGRHFLRIIFSDGYSAAAFTVAEASETPSVPAFSDVGETDWFFGHIGFALESGLMLGTAENVFSPNDAVTRGVLAVVLYRFEGEPAVSGDCPFSDVEAGAYCRGAVIWAAGKGIAEGFPDGTFRPDDPVTREQAAVMLCRYAEHLGLDTMQRGDLSSFSDAESIGGYALDATAWAVDAGLMSGMGGGILSPGGWATRAQLAAVLQRFAALVMR